ncbi:MAG: sigma-70 family RNA polymerase sigma factor [Verrucomicrobiaceae bacterium]
MPAFPDTQWTLILDAASTQTADGRSALDQLCRRYWAPLHSYARSRGYNPADADDITQSFFARLLENKTHSKAERERGRFRTFLLNAMQNFIANDKRDAARQKRGGGAEHDTIDIHTDSIATSQTPETLFEQRWAQAVIAAAITELENEHRAKGRADRFAVMRPLLSVRHDGDTAALAAQLNVTPVNFRKLLHGFRQRFGELVREEVARLVSDPSEIDDELRHLMAALAS